MISRERIEDIGSIARDCGLDFFPIEFEECTTQTMTNTCAYALPTRARHWRYGRSYNYQRIYGKMGFSKLYEMITNNNPSYAFIADTNTEAQNVLVVAHCFGHSDFFKNNIAFKGSDRSMVSHASEHAGRIDKYISLYGLDAVEHMMDAGFALESHIDFHKGLYRKCYAPRHIVKHRRVRGEFDDLLHRREKRPGITKEIVNATLPPRPERDLLWFFMNYAPLEEWERDILDIIREESFYFYPQMITQIIDEGWASYWHSEILYQYQGISPEEHIDFARTNEKVMRPGGLGRVNPYHLGNCIWKDIEKRWDKKYAEGKSDITGRQKIFKVREEDDDISFLRNYLTADLVKDLNMFVFGQTDENDSRNSPNMVNYEIKNRAKDEVIEALIKPKFNRGAPDISIVDASAEKICLQHNSENVGTLLFRYAEKTLEFIWELWAAPVELSCLNDDGNECILKFDEGGFEVCKGDFLSDMFEDDEEEEEKKS
jgi:stage V sporulation protein R